MNEWWDASTFNLTDLVRLIRFVKEDQKAVSYDRTLRDDEFLRIDDNEDILVVMQNLHRMRPNN